MHLLKNFSCWIALALVIVFSLVTHPQKSVSAETNEKLIELILDASGSMRGKLESKETKIAAAKAAVATFVNSLPDEQQLAFRAYGHQSAREKHNCQDTQLLVRFGKLSQNREKILSVSKQLTPRGYTPISFVLELAAKDFPGNFSGEKIIILVSDGKETCEGDPCTLASSLKSKFPKLIIHTVGLGVDEVTRAQLTCIAEKSGGTYFDAKDSRALAKMLTEAVSTPGNAVSEEKGMGWLAIKGPELQGHQVIDAKTGKIFEKTISATQSVIELPAGIYNVTFGTMIWKSVIVKPNETTTLIPGWLKVRHASYRGNTVLESETGEQVAELSNIKSVATILPGEYEVLFGKTKWHATVKQGDTTELVPGIVVVKHAHYQGHEIFDSTGSVVGSVSNIGSSIPLPPGDYAIQIGNKKIKFHLNEGEKKVFENK